MASNLTPDIEDFCDLFEKKANVKHQAAAAADEHIDRSDSNEVRRSLTVSTLAHYFGLRCDEFLRLSLNHRVESSQSETLRASLTKQRGISFEATLKSYYHSSILHDVLDEHQFYSYLTSSTLKDNGCHIGYNVKFRWTYDDHLRSNYKPDFLIIRRQTKENRLEITVADAKSSARMAIEHCVQVALYAIDLRVWIERNRLDEHVFIKDIGEIWLPSDDDTQPYERKTFPLRQLRARLEHFLQYDIDNVLTGSQWLMMPRCSLCPFTSRCRQRAKEVEPHSINNLSYLTWSAHASIHSFFHSSSLSSTDLQRTFDCSRGDSSHSDDQTKLQKVLSINTVDGTSAALRALQTGEPQSKPQSSFLLPKLDENLLLLFLVVLPNPSRLHSLALVTYNIYDTSNHSWFHERPVSEVHPTPSQVVSLIAQSLRELEQNSAHLCQLVMFDEQERVQLFEQLSLASDHEQIDQCLLLWSSSENGILLDRPPDIIQSDRVFRAHPLSQLKKHELEEELDERYGSAGHTRDSTAKVTRTELAQQLGQLNERQQREARETLVGLPFLICLHTAIRQSFVVPTAGFFDFEDLKQVFNIDLPSKDNNQLLRSIHDPNIDDLLHERLTAFALLYAEVQTRLSRANRLELNACALPRILPIQSGHPHIRRLIFLRQFEMLHTLRAMQQMRFDANELPIRIRIVGKITVDKFNPLWECRIERGEELISKNLTDNVTNTSDFRTYPYLISADSCSIRAFPDAVYMDTAIDGIRSRSKLDRCGLAHVQQMGEEQLITIRVKLCGLPLEINQQYYLSERYVDFNTKRAIQALERATSLTQQILDDPRELRKPQAIQKASREMQQEISNMFSKREPSIKPDGLHVLNRAQQEACEKVKNERVTLVWGPPGTGKTYWSSVTVFQMVMFSSSPLRILITACTHAAIDNLLSSINHLKRLFTSSPQFPSWSQLAEDLCVAKLDSTNYRKVLPFDVQCSTVVGSTVWTLQKLDLSRVFDIIFVDEATQLLTSDAVLALNRLANHPESRLIVAGDPLQLPPIKHCLYPPLPYPIPDLFASLFHCLLRDENNCPIPLNTEKPFEQIAKCPYLSVFDENHRMNEQLSDFARLLYGENYRQGRPKPLLPVRSVDHPNERLLGSLLTPSCSLYTLLVDSPSSSLLTLREDLDLESRLVSSLVDELVLRLSASSIFIITPHRMQRSAIRQAISNRSDVDVSITCDTVERMQGKEAQCVILCMMYRQREMLDNELDFIYNRQRINVSISRAQQLCIILTSQCVYNQAPLELFVNESTRNAYNLLSNFINKSSIRSLNLLGNVQ